MEFVLRRLTEPDLVDVCRIAEAVHVGLSERAAVFAEKLRLCPQGCRALALAGAAAGYVFSHPWRLGDARVLDAFLGALPDAPDCLYLHDLAIAPSARGQGAARAALGALIALAASEGFGAMALVSVREAKPIWVRTGFRDTTDPRLTAKLAVYGAEARYITKRLTEPPQA